MSVQRELFKNVVVDLAYVGNQSEDLLLFANYNQARPNSRADHCRCRRGGPIPQFGDITYAFNGGFSRYKASRSRWRRRRGSLRS